MAGKEFGGSKYFAMGAVWWFVIAGVLAVVRLVFPEWADGLRFVVVAVLAALIGPALIVFLFRPRP